MAKKSKSKAKARTSAKADPLVSEGARLERRAVRDALRRKLRMLNRGYSDPPPELSERELGSVEAYTAVLNFVLSRQKRYDKASGGLGRTDGKKVRRLNIEDVSLAPSTALSNSEAVGSLEEGTSNQE